MEAAFQACVDEFRDQGGTVLLSSHILAEVERLCDRVSIIREGRAVENGTLAELRHLTRTSIRAELPRPRRAWPPTRRARPGGRGQPGRLRGRNPALGRVAGQLAPSGIRTLTSQPPTLEELFLRHYGDDVTEPEDGRPGRPRDGAGTFLRTFLRRDRWMILWCVLGTTVLYWSQAVSIDGLYADQAAFDRAAASMESNPAFIAMAGPARALNTLGGQVAWQASAFGAVVVGLMVCSSSAGTPAPRRSPVATSWCAPGPSTARHRCRLRSWWLSSPASSPGWRSA